MLGGGPTIAARRRRRGACRNGAMAISDSRAATGVLLQHRLCNPDGEEGAEGESVADANEGTTEAALQSRNEPAPRRNAGAA